MLVLTRLKEQVIRIGDNVRVKVTDISGDRVRLGVEAPTSVSVHREEVYQHIQEQKRQESKPAQKPLKGGLDR